MYYLITIYIIFFLILVYEMHTAPVGYEDENGFHKEDEIFTGSVGAGKTKMFNEEIKLRKQNERAKSTNGEVL